MSDMGYISKEEKKVPITDPSGKWTDYTLLPEWSDDLYDVYTVKKHGKWIMLKTLKDQYKDDPKYQKMLEKEFDTRYNLAHANIVMVNDLEDVPGLGMCIITDDAYGYSLRRLIDEKRLTPKILERLQTQLLDALGYIQENHVVHHPITPDTIIFTEYTENLKLTDIGYDHTDSLSDQDTYRDIENYGQIMEEVLDHLPTSLPRMRRIAQKCRDRKRPYHSIQDVQLAVERRSSAQIYVFLCVFIVFMTILLIWLTR